MNGLIAPLLGCLLGAGLLAAGIAGATAGHWDAGLVLFHGGALLWGWSAWVQQPDRG